MSYARIGKDSDVYVYADGGHSVLVCCACRLHPNGLTQGAHESVFPETWGQALDHFLLHIRTGHRVPGRVFKRLVHQAQLEANEVRAPTKRKKAEPRYILAPGGPFPEQGKARRYKRNHG